MKTKSQGIPSFLEEEHTLYIFIYMELLTQSSTFYFQASNRGGGEPHREDRELLEVLLIGHQDGRGGHH